MLGAYVIFIFCSPFYAYDTRAYGWPRSRFRVPQQSATLKEQSAIVQRSIVYQGSAAAHSTGARREYSNRPDLQKKSRKKSHIFGTIIKPARKRRD